MRESTLTQAGRLAIFLAAFWLGGCAQNPVEQTLWRVDSLERIGGFPVTVLGDPQVIDTPFGNAVAFDGDGDRIGFRRAREDTFEKPGVRQFQTTGPHPPAGTIGSRIGAGAIPISANLRALSSQSRKVMKRS
jgi:hypothetical protein